ncbi:MAG: radical SAM protein [Bacillota bacterium]|nr:radical SAM protein [Bacillota bacterium]
MSAYETNQKKQGNIILSEVQSICPVCNKVIKARYVDREGKVFLEKECGDHGSFAALVSGSTEDYLKWVDHPVVNIPPRYAVTKGSDESRCPLDCGTCENHMQTACCVLIDVTERCNQHCPFCFARASENDFSGYEPTLEELEEKFDLLLELGEKERPFNIQLSGGEPTVREDFPQIIRMAKDKGFEYIQINTNGRRIAREEGYAKILRDAGASVIFMQFDGTNDEIYMQMRGEPLFEEKKRAILNCQKAGIAVTLVPTVAKNINLGNMGEMMDFLLENIAVVKGIHFQPVSFFGRHPDPAHENRVTMFDVLRELERQTNHFKYEDFCPISTGHTLCCFYSTYIREPDESIRCTLSKAQKDFGVSCCDASGQRKLSDEVDIVKRDRDYVLNKWEIVSPDEAESSYDAGKYSSSEEIVSLDEFLTYYRRNIFTVTGMAFQDISNLDAERLKRCRVQVLSPDNRLIPFCGYNSIYRD